MSWAIGIPAIASVASAFLSSNAASSASNSLTNSTNYAADLNHQGLMAQLEVYTQQYNNNMQMLAPMMQGQYNAQHAYHQLLGIGGNLAPPRTLPPTNNPEAASFQYDFGTGKGDQPLPAGPPSTAPAGAPGGPQGVANPIRQAPATNPQFGRGDTGGMGDGPGGGPGPGGAGGPGAGPGGNGGEGSGYGPAPGVEPANALAPTQQPPIRSGAPTLNAPPVTGPNNLDYNPTPGPSGYQNPMLNPTRMGSANYMDSGAYNHVQNNLMAPVAQPGQPNMVPPGTGGIRGIPQNAMSPEYQFSNDDRFRHARDTAITTEEFENSPGYAFQVEEMDRSLDRRNSAGGNYGGRAFMEAQRRARGLASQDYAQWATLRDRDLQREDRALDIWNDNRRGDITRMDNAFYHNEGMNQWDTVRDDTNYWNTLGAVGTAAGFGNPTATAVTTGGSVAGQIGSAYGTNAASNSMLQTNLGANLAQVDTGHAANVNEAIQSGLENYLTVSNL